jgi:DNA polymerase III delta prime subunit
MKESKLTELEQKELNALKEFLGALTAERDAIISFSLEGIIRENNRKEEILKRLEYIEAEKEKLNSSEAGCDQSAENDIRRALRANIESKVREVRVALEKNMKLLSFSMDHVKSSLERIIDFVNRTSYTKGRSISLMVSKRV